MTAGPSNDASLRQPPAAAGAAPPSRLAASFRLLTTSLGPLLALGLVVAFFTVTDFLFADGTFFTLSNLRTVGVHMSIVAVAALGMTIIIVAGGIDLSVGSAVALAATVVALAMREDVATLITSGTNFRQASMRLEEAQAALERAGSSDRGEGEAAVAHARDRLLQVIDDKLAYARERLDASADKNDQRVWSLAVKRLQAKQVQLADPKFRVQLSNAWFQGVRNAPGSAWVALLLGLATGVACGLLNGLLISSLKIVPFIVTLGTMTIFSGLAKLIPESPVRPQPWDVPDWIPQMLIPQPQPEWLFVASGVWIAFLLAALLSLVLRYSVMGRYVFAIGSNESTARLCGINVPAWKVAIYGLAGVFVGVAGIYNFARLKEGDPTSGMGFELRVIAAVVIGGASLSGGRGSVLGTLTGAAIMAVITSGCSQLGLKNPVQEVILGLIIIAAVTIDQIRQRRLLGE